MMSKIKKLMIAFTGAAAFYAQDLSAQHRNERHDKHNRHHREHRHHDHHPQPGYSPYAPPQVLPVIIVQPANPDHAIQGGWTRHDDGMQTRLEFLPNGKVRHYEDGMLESTGRYAFTNIAPDEYTRTNALYLKMNIDGDVSYYRINSIDGYSNGFLSMTSLDDDETMIFRRDYAPGYTPHVQPLHRRY